MGQLAVPKRPCSSCPYLKSTPPGVWDPSEYEKLAGYDEQTWDPDTHTLLGPEETNLSTFLCHHSPATGVDAVCRGWLHVHEHSTAVRIGMAFGSIPLPPYEPFEGECYASGAEARDAGTVIGPPDEAAQRVIDKVERSRGD